MKTASSLLLLCLVLTFSSCQQPVAEVTSAVKPGMTKITIMYPKSEGSTFDMDYYANKHMPMLKELFGDKMKHLAIDKGISGRLPTDPMPFMAIGYLYFNSIEEYNAAFGPNAEKILGDIPNYTNVRPTLQISEVVE